MTVGRSGDEVPDERAPRLTGRSAVRLHLTAGIGILVCVGAFTFEVTRALGGNALSWVYVIEWPVLGTFAMYMWWHLLHDTDQPSPPPSADASAAAQAAAARPPTAGTPGGRGRVPADPELEAWQQYLAELAAHDAVLAHEEPEGRARRFRRRTD